MKRYEKIYNELSKKYTDEEIGEAMLIPEDLTEEEKEKATEELLAFRFKLIQEQTEEERIYSDLLRFKYQMEDYIKNEGFIGEKSFGKHLEEYARILKRTKKKVSEDLNVHYTRLSRIINDREEPNIELAYRLEKHSGNLIPALFWWKLIIKKQEAFIKKDKKTRIEEASKVRNAMKFRA
ncbi:MAG: helix-turn-helix domain-containing protein [Aureispira sp.]|nr:helix-turn-helix domain-containing protein [Aureispira sp.]